MSTEIQVSSSNIDARVIESVVLRGDISGLTSAEKALYYARTCEQLGLNPLSRPFDLLKLNGKEVLYANKNCGDQLAKIYKIDRRVIDGPKLIDLDGTKLVYCLVEARTPDGRVETATATVPFADPINVLMKCETKAKRRATLSIVGLNMLDESELETIPTRAIQRIDSPVATMAAVATHVEQPPVVTQAPVQSLAHEIAAKVRADGLLAAGKYLAQRMVEGGLNGTLNPALDIYASAWTAMLGQCSDDASLQGAIDRLKTLDAALLNELESRLSPVVDAQIVRVRGEAA